MSEIIWPSARVVGIDEGYAWMANADGETASGWFVHEGCRAAVFEHPDDAGYVLLHVLGGPAALPGYEEDGVTVSLSKEGLRAFAGDLLAAVERMP